MLRSFLSFMVLSALLMVSASLYAADQAEAIEVKISTSQGDIIVELWPDVAPKTVENFVGLATGTKEFTLGGETHKRPYYDNLIFHRVIAGFMLQGGCPLGNGSGGPGYKFEDEISATALGLDKEKVLLPGQTFQLNPIAGSQFGRYFQTKVLPELTKQGLDWQSMSNTERENAATNACKGLTVQQMFEANGYKFNDKLASKKPVRGAICMANAGPNTNGSQFFINLVDTPHLTGLHTVFGKVVSGMDVVDAIGKVSVNPRGNRPLKDVVIHSIRPTK